MKIWFHVDLDAFYASVEQYDNPKLRGKPVIVGGADSLRGVVSACSYEARKFGVHSAMPIFQAKELCPQGIYVPVRMRRYQQVSDHIMDIFAQFAPSIQQISVDEAFLDMSGTQNIYGPPDQAAEQLKARVRAQTGLTASVGVAANRYIAKMASDRNKPDGICCVEPGREYEFISECRLEKLWGVGKRGLERLHEQRIFTVEQLREYSLVHLQKMFGQSSGEFYYQIIRGEDPGIFSSESKSRSIGNEITLEHDTTDTEELRLIFHQIAHHVMMRLMRHGFTAGTVGIKYKLHTFKSHTAQLTPQKPIYSAEEIFSYAWELFCSRWDGTTPLRLVGISLQSVSERPEPMQAELFEDDYRRKRKVEETVLELKEKGRSIMKATDLLSGGDRIRRKKE